MKNKFDENERYVCWTELIPKAKMLCWESVVNSLKEKDLQLLKTPSVWETESETQRFMVPEIVEKYTFKGVENLGLGRGDINFFTRLKSVFDDSPFARYDDNICAILYQLLKGVPKEQIKTFGLPSLPHILKTGLEKYMDNAEITVDDVLEHGSPRMLRWHGKSYEDPYVYSINMACAYGFDNIPEGLANAIQSERHKIAEKYDLLLGNSDAVPAQVMGFDSYVDAFTLIPADLSVIPMERLVSAITDLGEFVKNYISK